MKVLSKIAVTLFAAFLCTGASAAIYLKADATGDGSGTSWSNACTTWADALNKLRSETEDATLRIAKGLYTSPNSANQNASDQTVVSNAYFRIEGGYRAAEDGDLVRDPEVYQTIITGASVANLRKATWTRLTPVPGEFTVNSAGSGVKILDENDNLQFPSYEGAHDTFVASTSGGYIPLLVYGAQASGTVDGLKFVCWNRGSSRSGIIQVAGNTGPITITNCLFAGSCPQGGSLALSAPQNQADLRLVVDCKFMYNWVSYGTLGVTLSSKGRAIIRDCAFIGNSRRTDANMALISAETGDAAADITVEDCVFTRNLSVHKSSSTMIASGAGQYRGIVVTNNYESVTSAGAGGAALFSLGVARYSTSGEMEKCLVADNYYEFKPSADAAAVLGNVYFGSYDSNKPLVKDCLFRDNEIYADASDVASGNEFAMGAIGNSGVAKTSFGTVIGCTFVSNRVSSANLAQGAAARCARGLLAYGSSSKSIQYGVANCTFFGPVEDGVYDIVQYKAQAETMNVVNCIFAVDDPNAMAAPFALDAPDKLKVWHCSVQNLYPILQPADCGVWAGITYDPVPFEPVAFGVGGAMTLRPAANVPELRVACDLATNLVANSGYGFKSSPMTFVFREPNGEWQALTPKAQGVAANEKEPTLDVFGTVRPFGGHTRGGVQALSPQAETGVTLTLRTDPPLAAAFSAPANQSVAAGGAITPVTAVSDLAFKGWYNGDALYSDANPLVIDSLTADLTLTAKFQAKQTALTFALGEHGTFDENGEHEIVVEADAGSEFPEVPAFTIDEGWIFVGWDDLPRLVPETDASYGAKVVTKTLRVFHVAPVASGTGDGSSWENATDDFAAAYQDAAAYWGEVRVMAGTYRLGASFVLRSNVAVVGGFEGETVFSGDVKGDDYWKIDGGSTSAGAVWSDGVFNSPNSDNANRYWQAASASSDNCRYGFVVDAGGTATNVAFRNITFTGFGCAAVFADVGANTSGLAIKDCRFLANGTEASTSYKAISLFEASPMTMTDCAFVGNYGGLLVKFSAEGVTNSLARCVFTRNVSACIDKTVNAEGVAFNAADCVFTNNYSSGTVILNVSSTRNHGPSRLTNWKVARNFGRLIYANGANKNASDGDYWPNVNLEFDGCAFTGNTFTPLASGSDGLLISGMGRYYPVVFRDCYVGDNCRTNNGAGVLALAYSSSYHRYTFIDSTFENNRIVSTAEGGRSALVALDNMYGGIFTIATLMADNEVRATSPENAADFMMAHTSHASSGGTMVGCVIDESKYGQMPVRVAYAKTPLAISASALRGFDFEVCGGTVTTNEVFAGDALVRACSLVGPNGNRARGLSGLTSCSRLGVPLWQASNGVYYYRRAIDTNFRAIGVNGGDKNVTQGAAVGLHQEGPYLPDAWGRLRRQGKIAPGPLNAPNTSLIFTAR